MADDAVVVLERAQEAGLIVWLEGSDLKVKGQQEPTPQTRAVVESLKEHKEEVVIYLQRCGDGQPPPPDRPLENEEELRRWMDWTADPKRFAQWLEWAMTDESTNY